MAKLIPKGNIKKQGKEKGMRKIEKKQRQGKYFLVCNCLVEVKKGGIV